MTKLEYLNKKVKEVDERFEVVWNGIFVNLVLNKKPICYFRTDGKLELVSLVGEPLVKTAAGLPLAEEEQLILKGIKVFYEAYNHPKEYYIRVNNMFTPLENKYLNFNTSYLTYDFDNRFESAITRTKFTEEEIAEMPDEIQKAIECGFLVKEEVDE